MSIIGGNKPRSLPSSQLNFLWISVDNNHKSHETNTDNEIAQKAMCVSKKT